MPAPGNFRKNVPRTAATKAVTRATHRGAEKTKVTVVTRGGSKIFIKADPAKGPRGGARNPLARELVDDTRAKTRGAWRPGPKREPRVEPADTARARPARGVTAEATRELRGQSRSGSRPAARRAPHFDAGTANRPDPAARAPRRPDARPASVAATPNAIRIQLTGDYIELNQLLKLAGLATSGGGGKALVAAGGVRVDGKEELRKTCKIRAGQVVKAGDTRIRVIAAKPGTGEGPAAETPASPAAMPNTVAADLPAVAPRRARAAKAARAARKLAPE